MKFAVLQGGLKLNRTGPANEHAIVTTGSSSKVRAATFADYAQIASLQSQHGVPSAFEDWRHLWTANRAYLQLQREWPIGWVLEAEGRIVGYLGNIPTLYQFGDQQLVCGNGYGWVADENYRGHSICLLTRYLRQPGADLLMTNTAGATTFRALTAFGALPVPLGNWDRSSIWITGYTKFLTDRIARKKFPIPKLLSYPAALLLSVKDTWSRTLLYARSHPTTRVDVCTTFNEHFDDFWAALRDRNPKKLLAVRSRAVLQWHFDRRLREGRAWILTAGDGVLDAYAVLVMATDKAEDGIRRMLLADFQSVDEKHEHFYTLLVAALEHCREHDIQLLIAAGHSADGTDMTALAPYHLMQPACTFVYKAATAKLAEALSHPQAWCPSLYDADASL